MTLDQLRIFIAVAEREHVTHAARALGLTQSATSAAIAGLENAYGTKLFDRVGRGIRLTGPGRLFLAEARMVVARAAAAEAVLTDLAGLRRGVLNVAGSQTVANYWLPDLLHAFQEQHPGIKLDLVIGNTAEVTDRVRDGTAALGFVEAELADPLLFVDPVAEDELVLVAPPNHPLESAEAPFRSLELARARWIVREPGSGTRSVMEAGLEALGLTLGELQIGLELPSNETVRGAVEAGAGVTIISRLVVRDALAAGRLVRIALDMPRRRFYALRHRQHHFTQAAQAFLQLATAEMPAGAGACDRCSAKSADWRQRRPAASCSGLSSTAEPRKESYLAQGAFAAPPHGGDES